MNYQTSIYDELYHRGVLGMKWGHRSSKSSRKSTVSEDHINAQKLKKKGVKSLSNTELKKYNERANLEKQYNDLSKKQTSKGKKIISDILANSGKAAATTLATAAFVYGGKKVLTAAFGEDLVGAMFKKK